ncbi:MAG: hypothetical protein EB051_03770 [Chlamydiia bacterium]|nr:hypothetical protein [Chlamydiia bacterium]
MVASEPKCKNVTSHLKDRYEVPECDRWNVEALYPSWHAWEKDLDQWVRPLQKIHWPEWDDYQGRLADPKNLKEFLDKMFLFDRHLSRLYTYAHLRHDEDVTAEQANQAYTRMVSFLYSFREDLHTVSGDGAAYGAFG